MASGSAREADKDGPDHASVVPFRRRRRSPKPTSTSSPSKTRKLPPRKPIGVPIRKRMGNRPVRNSGE